MIHMTIKMNGKIFKDNTSIFEFINQPKTKVRISVSISTLEKMILGQSVQLEYLDFLDQQSKAAAHKLLLSIVTTSNT